MKILIASDSYKGSLSSEMVANGIKAGVLRVFPEAEVDRILVGDGGEGTVDAMVSAVGGSYMQAVVHGPNGDNTHARFGLLKDGSAMLELAEAAGLTLTPPEQRDVMQASTYGVGELILAALDRGCKKLYIGIGGSGTNDGGVGMLQALGASFRDASGREIGRGGGALGLLDSIDPTGLDPRLRDTEVVIMCDVTNPLCGPDGASAIYGPQKGATNAQVALLDQNLQHFADIAEKATGKSLRSHAGSGAAGGVGFAMMAFLNAKLLPGIQVVLEAAKFDERLQWADLVLTGEGKIDVQSVQGKVIDGISSRARLYHKPVIGIAGSLDAMLQPVFLAGVSSVEAAVCRPMSLGRAFTDAELLVTDAAERVMRTLQVGMDLKCRHV